MTLWIKNWDSIETKKNLYQQKKFDKFTKFKASSFFSFKDIKSIVNKLQVIKLFRILRLRVNCGEIPWSKLKSPIYWILFVQPIHPKAIIIIAHWPGRHFLRFRHLLFSSSRWWRKEVAVARSPADNYSLVFVLLTLSFFLFYSSAGGQREAGCSSDVCYHPVSWTRLHTGTGEPVPLPLLFSSALFEPAQEHPKVVLKFYQAKTVTSARHCKTGAHVRMHVRIVFYELASWQAGWLIGWLADRPTGRQYWLLTELPHGAAELQGGDRSSSVIQRTITERVGDFFHRVHNHHLLGSHQRGATRLLKMT